MFERSVVLEESLVGSNAKECFLFHKWIYDKQLYYKISDSDDVNYKYCIEIYKIKRCCSCKKEKYVFVKKEKFIFESDMNKRIIGIKMGLFQ